MHDVSEDYRTLLADGIVRYVGPAGASSEQENLRQWESALVALAAADGLRAGLFYMHTTVDLWEHTGRLETEPVVALLHGDHSKDPDSNIFPYDQTAAAAWHRPRAEAVWGETLARARTKVGL